MKEKKIQVLLRVEKPDGTKRELHAGFDDPKCLEAVGEAIGRVVDTGTGAIDPASVRDEALEARVTEVVAPKLEDHNEKLREAVADEAAALAAWRAGEGKEISAEYIRRRVDRIQEARKNTMDWFKQLVVAGYSAVAKVVVETLTKGG